MTPAHVAAPQPGEPAAVARLPALVRLCFLAGPMLSMIDSSVVNVAVPAIVRGLHTTLGTAAWAVSGYLLGLACGLAATPWLARRYGTRPAYAAALLAFTLASAACAVVPGVGLLIAARVVQGLAGAPMVPLAMSLILDPARATDRTRGMPASAGVMLFAAPALGPAVGGLLISGFGWRSVFLVNLPIGLAALVGARAARRAAPTDIGDRSARLDVPGLLLLAAGLGLATYGASRGPSAGWLAAGSAPAWAGGLALVAAYLVRERRPAARRRAPAPVNLGLLRSPARARTLALACVASVVLFAVLFLAPVFLQQIQHHGTTVTGLVLLPQGVVMGLASWLGNALIERGKTRPAVITASVAGGLALLAASTLGLLLLTASTPLWVTTGLLCGRGLALGLTVQPLVMALLDGLGAAAMPDANTLFNMAERLSGSFGVALLATLYASRAAATGSPVTALHDCALVLTVAAAVGAVAAACNHGVSANDAGYAQGGRSWTPSPQCRRQPTSRSGSTRRGAPTGRPWKARSRS
jgi:EmrB/QacA subfamily drug resistance transporter